MAVRAVGRHIRLAPRKTRLVIDMIRGKSVKEALALLKFTNRAAAPIVAKVINSAVANAEHNHDMHTDKLYVKTACVDAGPILQGRPYRKYIYCARGRASVVRQRTSHITIEVVEK